MRAGKLKMKRYPVRKRGGGWALLLLFGILPEYRMRGLPLLLLNFLFETARKDPQFQTLEGSWSLESNDLINGVIEDFGGIMSKR